MKEKTKMPNGRCIYCGEWDIDDLHECAEENGPVIPKYPPVPPANQSELLNAERLAERFHAIYERLAPYYGYRTREESATEWPKVPENNRKLMIHVCAEILREGI